MLDAGAGGSRFDLPTASSLRDNNVPTKIEAGAMPGGGDESTGAAAIAAKVGDEPYASAKTTAAVRIFTGWRRIRFC